MTIKPITPNEVGAAKVAILPSFVFEVFNDLIARNWNGRESVVKQDSAVEAMVSIMVKGMDGDAPAKYDRARKIVFEQGYLNIEEAYHAAGWTVRYDKPAYCETGPAIFTFTKG